ncbi:cytochrome P450 [Sphingomonas sp. AR_OL41]|uniref:cytochrome P450 n=1 Tax=Sphingomonas sp. AR_OL41 TaxID=3042729 RepID=UPI00247FC339|nr:cytochrome P450 [Sphingomonas sp. AR_OL41]MDH7973432.1 cytochrome P450 [Sphingomonas sp. AR_OL41]
MSAIIEDDPPPFFVSPDRPPSAWAMLRHAISDPAAVIPASIYEHWAIKLPGPVSPVVITHPDDVRRVLLDKGELFGRNRQLRMMMRRAWGRGLAAAQGPDWARQRHAASPAFRPPAVEASVAAMAQVTRHVAAGWPASGGIDLGAAMGRIVAENRPVDLAHRAR